MHANACECCQWKCATLVAADKNSSESAELLFTLHSTTAVTLEKDEVIFFYCSTRTYEVMSGPLTCHCCFPHSLLPPLQRPPPPIPLGAEVIQKECRALVQQMIEGEKETEERKESNTKIKDCVFFCSCGVVKNFLFCFSSRTMKCFWEQAAVLLWAFFWCTSEKNEKHVWLYFLKTIWGVCCYLLSASLKRFWRTKCLFYQFTGN